MTDDSLFLKTDIVHVDAAVIGISKARWETIQESAAEEHYAADKMKAERFDVLPIVASDSSVREYFATEVWNDYSSVVRRTLTHRDVIPLQTHIRDVVKGFTENNRLFYFLTQESRVVGLISVANLNSREVKVYLFALLSELEVRLGIFLSDHLPEERLFELTLQESRKDKHKELRERYLSDKANGVDVSVVQYLYLPDLADAVVAAGLHTVLGYASKSKFEKSFGSFTDLRNQVAHPNHSIIKSKSSLSRLWERIDRIEEALFQLR